MAQLRAQPLGQRNQNHRAYHRSPQRSDTAEKRENQGLRRYYRAQHAMRSNDLQHHRMEPAGQRTQGAAGDKAGHLDPEAVYAGRFGRHFILLDRQHGQAEA